MIFVLRFGNDLLLWQPTAPTPREHQDGYITYAGMEGGLDMTQLMNIGNTDRFTMCRSAAAALGKLVDIKYRDSI